MSSVCYYPVWNKYNNALHFPIYPVSALNQYQPLCLQQMESWGDTGCNMESACIILCISNIIVKTKQFKSQ